MRTLATHFQLTAVLAEEISESAYLDHNGDTKLKWALTKQVQDAAINQCREQHSEIMADRELLWDAWRELGQMIGYQNGKRFRTEAFNEIRVEELRDIAYRLIEKYDAWDTSVWLGICNRLSAVGVACKPSDRVPDP